MDENAAFYEKGKIPTAKESEEGFLHMIEELYERYRDDADDALNPKKLLAEICKCYPHAIPVPEVTVCQYYNDSNLIGALCVYLNRRK